MFEFDEDGAAEIRKLLGEAKGNLLVLCEEKAGNFEYLKLAENDPIRKAIHAIDLISLGFVSDDDNEDEEAA